MRKIKGLAFNSQIEADPSSVDGWRITTDGRVVQNIPFEEMRFLLHWSANVYMDKAELKRDMEHTDDLSIDRVFDIFIKDMKARGIEFKVPSDPLHDAAFVTLLNKTYDPGLPLMYPEEAPGPFHRAA